jgi:hypothetical protein
MDPFRTRASMWAFLPAARRRTLMKELHQEILTRRQRSLRDLEPDDPVARELLLLQLAMRLQWLKQQE